MSNAAFVQKKTAQPVSQMRENAGGAWCKTEPIALW